MKRILGLSAVALALGFWAGVGVGQSTSVKTNIEAGLAIVIGSNLLFCLWLWYRAKPGSGDAMVLPSLALLMASMLLGILPHLFWPDAKDVQIAGSVASIVVPIVSVIMWIRHRRSLRRAERPV